MKNEIHYKDLSPKQQRFEDEMIVAFYGYLKYFCQLNYKDRMFDINEMKKSTYDDLPNIKRLLSKYKRELIAKQKKVK